MSAKKKDKEPASASTAAELDADSCNLSTDWNVTKRPAVHCMKRSDKRELLLSETLGSDFWVRGIVGTHRDPSKGKVRERRWMQAIESSRYSTFSSIEATKTYLEPLIPVDPDKDDFQKLEGQEGVYVHKDGRSFTVESPCLITPSKTWSGTTKSFQIHFLEAGSIIASFWYSPLKKRDAETIDRSAHFAGRMTDSFVTPDLYIQCAFGIPAADIVARATKTRTLALYHTEGSGRSLWEYMKVFDAVGATFFYDVLDDSYEDAAEYAQGLNEDSVNAYTQPFTSPHYLD